jgi:6-pyruvoyltetrahydropterin/6-carboxytetrahydropterin synthase
MTFSAGHRLYNPAFSDQKNREVFEACSNPNSHGHNYRLEVQITGPINPETGMIVNLKGMKKIIDEEVVSKVDHMNLNTDVDFMTGIIPTTENLAVKIFEILDRKIGKGLLSRVILWETDNNRAEVSR